MMKDSLKKLLDKFPYFFDKSSTSNLYKSQSVTNNQFKEIYQSLFLLIESFRLDKRCLIWKEQSQAHDYSIHFIVHCPRLKTVRCYKNDTSIYSESYSEGDDVNSFFYLYEGTDQENIIPIDTFYVVAETYDETILEKGFPENDEKLGNIFDHDESLDEIGSFNNIPRKTYAITEDYANTEPSYNDRLSEDDYHYMNRILNYNIRFHTTSLPVLELWKLYGLNAGMTNRSEQLFRMWDENKHDGDNWTPQPWEHKDILCDPRPDLGKFFFVSANTVHPMKNQKIRFTFRFLNMYAEPLDSQTYVDIILNEETIETDYSNDTFVINASELEELDSNVFQFTAKDGTIPFGTIEVEVKVAGCNDGNWYVSTTGDDTDTGKSSDHAFATIQKALDSVEGEENFVVIIGSTHTINSPLTVRANTKILGCENAVIENTESNAFFDIPQNITVDLQDCELVHDDLSVPVTSLAFENVNINKKNMLILINEEWEDEE